MKTTHNAFPMCSHAKNLPGIPQTDLGGFIFETPNKNLGILRILCTCEWSPRVEKKIYIYIYSYCVCVIKNRHTLIGKAW